jgi:uncharacterized protein YneF (UPF0154 family)
MPEIIVPTSLFITLSIVIGIFIISRHREKMYAMERGMTPEMVNAIFQRDKSKRRDKYSTLKWGMMFFFVGIAAVIMAYAEFRVEQCSDGFKFAAISLSIGTALLITYYIIRNDEKKLEKTQS